MDSNQNVRPERKTVILAREVQRYHIDIAGLQETRLSDEGQVTELTEG